MSNPFKRVGKQPRLGVKSFSVEDVKAADKRFYDKFPGAVEDAAMLKKAMQNPGDEVVKVDDSRKAEHAKMMKAMKIEVEIS
jgi:hypothetical protein|tara:strand:- start:1002 stop:1247 length:246 start_codon:yes stop_codon:yes gene_type:complete